MNPNTKLDEQPEVLLKGNFPDHNYRWCILHNGMGFRCGYVCIPKSHPFYGKNYDKLDIQCHGGLTYSSTLNNEYWIGFDCAHSGDAQDESLPHEVKMPYFGGIIRTTDYCRIECFKIYEQLLEQDRKI